MNPSHSNIVVPALRTGQGSTRLSRKKFSRRYQAQFYDPALDEAKEEIQRLTDIAWEAYATSHEALDRDTAFMQEAANAATILMEAVREMRRGREEPGHDVESPRPK